MVFNYHDMVVALKAALHYTPVSILISIVPMFVGLLCGTLIALVRIYRIRFLAKGCQIFVTICKGIPLILVLLIFRYVFSMGFEALSNTLHLGFGAKDVPPIFLVFLAMCLFATVNISEIVRGALGSVEKGQFEAAYSIGLTRRQALRRIILPQAFPVAVPMLCSSLIGLFKGSSLAFVLSVTDLLNGALITATGNYAFLEAYVAAAMVYWAVCILIERFSMHLEKKLRAHIRVGLM